MANTQLRSTVFVKFEKSAGGIIGMFRVMNDIVSIGLHRLSYVLFGRDAQLCDVFNIRLCPDGVNYISHRGIDVFAYGQRHRILAIVCCEYIKRVCDGRFGQWKIDDYEFITIYNKYNGINSKK